MTGYKATITSVSNENLTKVEKIKLKELSDAVQLVDAVKDSGDSPLVVTPELYAMIHVENPNTKEGQDKEYDKLVIIDKSGVKFVTGSEAFISNFMDIAEEMEGDEFSVKVISKESKNYNGYFITCAIV